MAINEFVDDKKAEITRLQRREKAFKLGKATMVAAQQKGLTETVTAPNSWGESAEWLQLPFMDFRGTALQVALRKASKHERFVLVVEIDENNIAPYAGVESGEPNTEKITYATSPDDIAVADRQVLEAFSGFAKAMGLDPKAPEFNAGPVSLTMTPL